MGIRGSVQNGYALYTLDKNLSFPTSSPLFLRGTSTENDKFKNAVELKTFSQFPPLLFQRSTSDFSDQFPLIPPGYVWAEMWNKQKI